MDRALLHADHVHPCAFVAPVGVYIPCTPVWERNARTLVAPVEMYHESRVHGQQPQC